MDFQKEKESFEDCYKTSRDYKFYVKHEMSEKQIFEFKNDKYVVDCVNGGWKIWQAATAQAVPEGFVLMPKEPTQNIYRTFYDAFNSADAGNTAQNFKVAYKAMIEAQEQSHV